VIQPEGENLDPVAMTAAYTGPGVMVNSAPFDGQPNEVAKEAIADLLEQQGKGAKP